jgi:DNA-binding Lrp family transcriptional regulator
LQDSCDDSNMKAVEAQPILDDLDRRILAALQLDPRASWSKIGRIVGTSETTALRRVQRLRDSGVVIVTALGDPQRCRFGQPVLLHFSTAPEKKWALAEYLAERPDVQYVSLVTGRCDVMCELISPDGRYLSDILMHQLPDTGLFDASRTAVVLKRFKTKDQWSRVLLDGIDFSEFEVDTADGDDEQLAPLDAVDTRILGALVSDGRRTYADVAGEVGISETVVGRRIQALAASKQLSFVAMVDPATLGFEVEAMLHLRVELDKLDETARAVAAMSETRYVSATSGDSDLIMDVVLKDTATMYEFVSRSLGSLPGIRDVEIDIVLESVKRGFQYPLFSPSGSADGVEMAGSRAIGPAWQTQTVI